MNQFESPNSKTNIISYKTLGTYFFSFIGLLLLLTLSFHYIIPTYSVFPKESLSFNHTFVTDHELIELSEKYHDANFRDKLIMSNDPFIRKLIEENALYTIKDVTEEDGSITRDVIRNW